VTEKIRSLALCPEDDKLLEVNYKLVVTKNGKPFIVTARDSIPTAGHMKQVLAFFLSHMDEKDIAVYRNELYKYRTPNIQPLTLAQALNER
jgi:hypothetical protein